MKKRYLFLAGYLAGLCLINGIYCSSDKAETTTPSANKTDASQDNLAKYKNSVIKELNKNKKIIIGEIATFITSGGIPKQLAALLSKLPINDPVIGKAPEGFSKGFTLSGSINFANALAPITINFVTSKTISSLVGISLHISLPDGWKLSQSFPSLSAFDSLTLKHATFILSNFPFQLDEDTEIVPGLTFDAQIDLKTVNNPPIMRHVSNLLQKSIESINITGVLKPKLEDSTFK
ncbi:MAG: hypothetical protein WBQ73_02195, partial [Candidatus Babeliales bacterium]